MNLGFSSKILLKQNLPKLAERLASLASRSTGLNKLWVHAPATCPSLLYLGVQKRALGADSFSKKTYFIALRTGMGERVHVRERICISTM